MDNLARIVSEEISDHNITHATVAAMTSYSRSAITNYLNEKRQIPRDLIKKLADGLKSARLKILHSWLCGCGFFKTKYLGGVDKHPATVKMVAEEELMEALEAYRNVSVKNKLRREDFNAEEWVRYEYAMEQLCDVHALIEVALESGQLYYGLDVEDLQKRINAKLDARGYTKEKSALRRAQH